MKETFEDIKNSGRLIYQYIRGSHAYGLNVETSDIDTGGVYITDNTRLLGLRSNYCEQIADEKNDNVWYEVGRFLELLLNSNPNMLEALFIPERCILYKHPIMDIILENRHKFLTKKAFKALTSYGIEQVRKARGLNKKIVNPITERKEPIDFCYTFRKQGTQPIQDWLKERGLKQIYCGLNHLPNMDQMYGVYYDWGQHIHMEWKTAEEFAEFMMTDAGDNFLGVINEFDINLYYSLLPSVICGKEANRSYNIAKWIKLYNEEIKPKGYHGIVKEDGSSCYVHLDSIIKGDKPICWMSYNDDGFQSHCKQYKDYKDWETKRNQARYESNLKKNYDSKYIMHCVRLIQMGIELAKTGELNVDREKIGDRQFLLDIRNHKYEYDYLIEYCEKKKAEMEEAIKTCNLPEEIDKDFVNELLIKVRQSF